MGKIVVIKGIGGFYFVCDVCNSNVVVIFWVCKYCLVKLLVVMLLVVDGLLDVVCQLFIMFVVLIVLVDKKYVFEFCDDIVFDFNEVGVMLFVNLFQYLLLQEL